MIPTPILEMFSRLDAAGIDYVVLRGYLPLEELAESLDIDVYIAPHDRARADAVLSRAGWLVRRHQTGRWPHRFYDNFDMPGRVSTMLDVVYGLYYGPRLHRLADAERVLATAETLDGVRVPHPWVALLTFALHVLVDKEELSEANARRARALWELCGERPEGAALVESGFGTAARRLAARFAESAAAPGAPALEELRRQAVALPCLRPHPALAILDSLVVRARRRLARPARVAVLGMDGSGKTTLVRYALSLRSPLPIGSAYLGRNEFTTRTYLWLLTRSELRAATGTRKTMTDRALAKARNLWWPLELHARMRRAEWGKAIVLYDRFPFPRYERDSDPTTIPGHVMGLYERLWVALLGRPDALLFCDGDPEVLWARKREYAMDVYLRGRARYLRLMDEFLGERHVVATDGPRESAEARVPEILRSSAALRRRISRGAGAGFD